MGVENAGVVLVERAQPSFAQWQRWLTHKSVGPLEGEITIASSGRAKTSRWLPRRSKAQPREACKGTPSVRHVATMPSSTHAR